MGKTVGFQDTPLLTRNVLSTQNSPKSGPIFLFFNKDKIIVCKFKSHGKWFVIFMTGQHQVAPHRAADISIQAYLGLVLVKPNTCTAFSFLGLHQ